MRSRLIPRAFQWLLVTVVLTTVLLVAAEGMLRGMNIHFPGLRFGDRSQDLWVFDRTKGWFHRPSFAAELAPGGSETGRVRTNALGLRGADVSLRKPPGTKRLLAIGDSFLFAESVDEERIFTTRLKERLNTRGPERWEVMNLGVNGYSTDQELILFEELGPRLEPDIVVLFVCDNDFEGNTQDFMYQRYYKPYFVLSGDGKLDRRNTPVPGFTRWQKTKLWLGQRSEVWNGIRSRRSPIPWVNDALASFQVATPRPPPGPALPITAALIVAMREQAAWLGSEFVVLNTGYRGERTELHQKLRPLLRRENVRLLGIEGNLDEARKRDPKGLWDFPNDIHWNVAAHDLVAHITFNFLEGSGLLGKRSLQR